MNDKNFEPAVEYLKILEGGYVNDPRDSGGETKYGISAASNPGVDIKNLTWEGAKKIYKAKYWDAPKLGLIDDCRIVCRVFEQCVVGGQRVGVRLLQCAYNDLTHSGTLAPDGLMGPKTANAINSYPHKDALYAAINKQAANRYPTLKNWNLYADSWMRRLGIEPPKR